MTDWRLGTMGFAYKDWKGPFYPEALDGDEMLSFYSRVFNAVEIDSTFYGAPRPDTVKRWAAITPPDFRFCAKLPRVITHDLKLSGAAGLLDEFTGVMRLLGDKLGMLLIQLPPSFTLELLPSLAGFVASLPQDLRFAVEFRHRSWYSAETEVHQLLAEHGVCWAATEYPDLPARLLPVRKSLYIRWIGQHGAFQRHDRERIDRSEALRGWLAGLQHLAADLELVYGFFNNDYAGFAPATLNRFKELAGLPIEDSGLPRQLDFLGDL